MKNSNPFGCLVRKYNEIASCALTIGSPPVCPRSYDKNSVPRNVASLGALSLFYFIFFFVEIEKKKKNYGKWNNIEILK